MHTLVDPFKKDHRNVDGRESMQFCTPRLTPVAVKSIRSFIETSK